MRVRWYQPTIINIKKKARLWMKNNNFMMHYMDDDASVPALNRLFPLKYLSISKGSNMESSWFNCVFVMVLWTGAINHCISELCMHKSFPKCMSPYSITWLGSWGRRKAAVHALNSESPLLSLHALLLLLNKNQMRQLDTTALFSVVRTSSFWARFHQPPCHVRA